MRKIKGKPIRPDFTTEREKNIKKRYKIYRAVDIIFALLAIGGLIFGGIYQENDTMVGIMCIYEGVVCLIAFLFHMITWKIYDWEQITPTEYKYFRYSTEKSKEENNIEGLIVYSVLGIASFAFIIMGIVKLV